MDSPEPRDRVGSEELRLDSWKEIAAYLGRHVTTVRRWEKREGLPVHRHVHDKLASVYAFRGEIDAWWRSRRVQLDSRGAHRAETTLGSVRNGKGAASSAFGARQIVPARFRLMVGGAIGLSLLLAAAYLTLSESRTTIRVTPGGRGSVVATGSLSPEAGQEYAIGRYHLWRDNEEHLQRAIVHFTRATEIDPQYAAAYAGLAHAWWKRGLWARGEVDLIDAEEHARSAVRQARQLDAFLPDAYVVEADLERLYSRDLARAEGLVQHALTLNPDHVDAHYTYALLLMTLGRFPEAIAHMATAEGHDPLAPAIQSDFGRILYRAGRYDEAIPRLKRALELEPAMGWLVQTRLAEVYVETGQYDLALAALRQDGNESVGRKAQIARVMAHMGHDLEAKRLLREVETSAGPLPVTRIAAAHAALGDNDKAFRLLFDQIERMDPGPNFIAVDPPLAHLRSDPRWNELLRRMNALTATIGESR